MRIGAHVSTAGGLDKAIDRAQAMGAEAVQVFASSPRAWGFKAPSEESVLAFRDKAQAADISPVFLHAIYLANLGGEPDLVTKSVDSLTAHMLVAGQLGAVGVVLHCGSHLGKGFDSVLGQAVAALREVLSRSSPDTWLILENSAGMGSHIGASFQQLGRLLDAVDSPRVMICLDTAHTLAAGYNLSDPEQADSVMELFDGEIGLPRLVAVHANDSKAGLGSGIDRHENIGDGHIGVDGFRAVMAHPAFRSVPFLLEVPGLDGKGPDRENVDRLKGVRESLGIAP